jgi:hypothetical protein
MSILRWARTTPWGREASIFIDEEDLHLWQAQGGAVRKTVNELTKLDFVRIGRAPETELSLHFYAPGITEKTQGRANFAIPAITDRIVMDWVRVLGLSVAVLYDWAPEGTMQSFGKSSAEDLSDDVFRAILGHQNTRNSTKSKTELRQKVLAAKDYSQAEAFMPLRKFIDNAVQAMKNMMFAVGSSA